MTLWQVEGAKGEVVTGLLFLGSESLQMVPAARKSDDCPLAGKLWQTERGVEKANKSLGQQRFI